MFERIYRIIKREQARNPKRPLLYSLVNRLMEIQTEKLKNVKMNIKKDSTFTTESEIFMCSLFPKKTLDIVIVELRPSSVLDVGCGVGKSLEYFLANNIDALGIENSDVAISKSIVKNKILKYNLKSQLNLQRSFDLVWCFEVIEHIHPNYENAFLKNLTLHSDKIIVSAAQPGQGGHGHFNEQLPEYWIQKFSELGYYYEEDFTKKLKATNDNHAENLLFFIKDMNR